MLPRRDTGLSGAAAAHQHHPHHHNHNLHHHHHHNQYQQDEDGQHTQYALEDMISSLQTRGGSLDDLTEDPLELLKQRERDLVLAAELGKALLERNQELTKKSEALTEKYAKKIEALEQERHLMRRKLEEARGESEACALELQSDLDSLRRQLDEQSERARRAERDQASLVSELTAQNTRLADQLREAARQEEQLLAELKLLREKCAHRSTTLQDHVSSLEVLKDEVQLVSAQRTELERRSLELREERARAVAALEEAEERATALERLGHEAERRAIVAERERDELALALAAMENSSSSSSASGSPSKAGGGADSEGGGRYATSSPATAGGRGGHHRQPRSLQAEMECEESGTSSLGLTEADEDLRQEVGRACRRLRELASHLQRGEDDSGLQSDCDESMLMGLNNGVEVENNCPNALTDLVEEVFGLALAGVRGGPGDLGLAVELHRAKEELDQTKEQLRQAQDELKRRADSLVEAASRLKLSEAELHGAREERDRARDDIEHSQLSKDEVLAQALQTRDQAVARKNKVEVELARTRIDMLQINSQLMEAIQQKIELSEQLEQWQMDMQTLLDEHVRSKLAPIGRHQQQQHQQQHAAANGSDCGEVVAPARKKRNSAPGASKKRFGIF